MTTPKTISANRASLETVWNEAYYTEALLTHDEDASDLAPAISALVERIGDAKLAQMNAWRAEAIAQALIRQESYRVQRLITQFHRALTRSLEDAGVSEYTDSSLYKTYFPEPLSRVSRIGLDSQLKRISGWPSLLSKETNAILVAFSGRFTDAIKKGNHAVQGLYQAEATSKTHRNQHIEVLFDEFNKERQTLYGKLVAREAERSLPKGWASSFFYKSEAKKEKPTDQKQEAILLILSSRGIEYKLADRTKITTQEDVVILDKWLSRALSIEEIAELFAS